MYLPEVQNGIYWGPHGAYEGTSGPGGQPLGFLCWPVQCVFLRNVRHWATRTMPTSQFSVTFTHLGQKWTAVLFATNSVPTVGLLGLAMCVHSCVMPHLCVLASSGTAWTHGTFELWGGDRHLYSVWPPAQAHRTVIPLPSLALSLMSGNLPR